MFGSRRSAILWISWLSIPFCLRNRYVPGVANSSTLSLASFCRAGNIRSLSLIFPAETRTFFLVFLPSSFRLKPRNSSEFQSCSSAMVRVRGRGTAFPKDVPGVNGCQATGGNGWPSRAAIVFPGCALDAKAAR